MQARRQLSHLLCPLHDSDINAISWEEKSNRELGRARRSAGPCCSLVPSHGSCGVFLGLVRGVAASGGTEEEKRRRQGDTAQDPPGLRKRTLGWGEHAVLLEVRGHGKVGLELVENCTVMGLGCGMPKAGSSPGPCFSRTLLYVKEEVAEADRDLFIPRNRL